MKAISIALDRPVVKNFGATLVFAGLTALLAQAAVRLPFTPIPVTLQVLGMALSGLLLGSRLGALAQLEYLMAGLAGAPVFAGGSSGIVILLGPSGGYLPGFVLGAFITGLLFERCHKADMYRAFAAGMAGVAMLYICGVAWLTVWLTMSGAQSSFSAWLLGALPFISIDAMKVTFAAMVASGAVRWKK